MWLGHANLVQPQVMWHVAARLQVLLPAPALCVFPTGCESALHLVWAPAGIAQSALVVGEWLLMTVQVITASDATVADLNISISASSTATVL